jgi:hypothetical protein
VNNKTTALASLLLTSLTTSTYADHRHVEEISVTRYQAKPSLALEVSPNTENLFDHKYKNHLAGYNRNGDRLPRAGRNLYASFTYNW